MSARPITTDTENRPIDAVLVLSFGGPEQPEDVMPFLRNVTRGRNVPEARLAEVAEQYARFGGRSPINDQCRALVAALEAELRAAGDDLPVYWGNRNWTPYLTDTVARMAGDGIGRAAVFVTSAFGSYSGCRQYREDLAKAAAAVGPAAPRLDKLRLYYNHPGFIEPMAANLTATIGPPLPDRHRLIFTAHSIPRSMAAACSYEAQLDEAARLVLERAGFDPDYDVVYQSRSGPPSVPWLEPDINDHLLDLAARGYRGATLIPVGFISDHMEVMFDLDTQAAETAAAAGLALRRVPTVGTDPRFVTMIRELVDERRYGRPRLFLGPDGPWPDTCPDGHCAPPARPTGPYRPAPADRSAG